MAFLDLITFEQQSFTAGIEVDSNSGTPTIDTTTVYSAGASMRVNGTTVSKFFTKQFTGTNVASDKFVQFRMRIHDASTAAASAMALFRDATNGNGPSIRLNSALTLELWDEQAGVQRGSDSTALTVDTWYLIGLKYSRAAGTCALYINDMTTPVASGATTSLMSMDTIRLGSIDAFTCDLYFDDVILTDSSGSNMTGFAGDVKVHTMWPNGAGEVNTFATQTGGTAGAANNFTRVNEVTPDDATTLNGSSTLNQEDLFDITDPPSDMSDTISVFVVGGRFRNSTADTTAALRFELEKANGGTKTQSANIVPNSTTFRTNVPSTTLPKTYPIIAYQNPDAAAWTKALVTSSRFGYKLQVGPGTAGRRIDVTNVWGHVIYSPVTNVTTTQTITGKARITAATLQTITGKARVTAATLQTITGKARIRETVSQTIAGLSRISAATLQTITGKARVTASTSKTITGKAAIQDTTTQTITGKSRIRKTATQTITGLSRITASVLQTITGKARIQESTSQTITGKSRITAATTKIITGLSRITASTLQTITGKARIQESSSQTITGKSRITATTSQTITGKSRIQQSVQRTIDGIARITKTTSQTIAGLSSITASVLQTITGKSRIQKSQSQTITGKSRVQAPTTQTITGTGRVQLTSTQTISGKASIVSPNVSGLGSNNTVLRMKNNREVMRLFEYRNYLREKEGKTFLREWENTTVLRMRD